MRIKNIVNSAVKLFEQEDNEFISLDLGSKYIKVISVKDNRIKSIFTEKNKKQGVKSAVDLLKKNNLTAKKIKLALKGPDTIIRYVTFPKVGKGNIREAFTYEISKYVPFPQGSVYFDIFVIDDNYSKEELLVLLAAAKKPFIDSLSRDFANEKINISGISLSNLALMNLFSLVEDEDSNTAIVDIGFSSTLLSLIKKNTPYLSREIKISGKNILDKLSKVKKLAGEELEDMLLNSPDDAELLEAQTDVISELSKEIKSSFDYFEMNVGEQIKDIYLTGGFSGIKEIDKIMNSFLEARVKIWDPWSKLQLDPSLGGSAPKETLSVVLGLSL